MLILTDQCDVWRMTQRAGHPTGLMAEQIVFAHVACLVIPASEADVAIAFADESTHVALLPMWLTGQLLKEDEIRVGRRTTQTGQAAQYRYVVNGIRSYGTFGLRHLEAFCTERQ